MSNSIPISWLVWELSVFLFKFWHHFFFGHPCSWGGSLLLVTGNLEPRLNFIITMPNSNGSNESPWKTPIFNFASARFFSLVVRNNFQYPIIMNDIINGPEDCSRKSIRSKSLSATERKQAPDQILSGMNRVVGMMADVLSFAVHSRPNMCTYLVRCHGSSHAPWRETCFLMTIA